MSMIFIEIIHILLVFILRYWPFRGLGLGTIAGPWGESIYISVRM